MMGKKVGLPNSVPKVEEVEKGQTRKVSTSMILNKTNQKQVIEFKGESLNLPPRGKIQIQASFEEVAETLIFWVRKEIISITKN